jgi:NAD+ synthase (glutamine-hydrolysing)
MTPSKIKYMKKVRIALCQINPTVGDLSGNVKKILDRINKLKKYLPDIIAFPELAVTGYPPEDLLLKPHFIDDNIDALQEIRKAVGDFVAIVGFVDKRDDIFNAAAVIHQGEIVDIYHKIHLPNYGVFDEFRYFRPGKRYPLYRMGGVKFGINICEDIWYPEGPAAVQARHGAELIININASPYHMGKSAMRSKMLSTRASDNNIVVAYLNTVGGQDELVFDGHSLVFNEKADLIAEGKRFEEDDLIVDVILEEVFIKRLHAPCDREAGESIPGLEVEEIHIERKPREMEDEAIPSLSDSSVKLLCDTSPATDEEVYKALALGTGDYVIKNGFGKVCIGLSGGIDSSLVASIAVDAIGKDNVTGIFMPSPYTSSLSKEDAYALAANLDIKIIEVPIAHIFDTYTESLRSEFRGLPAGIAEENLQARIRGNILMGFSNKFGWLVLTTGNKSEMSVGYATLYGDMAGGFAPIKDVPKTLVFRLSKWKNASCGRIIIPESVLSKEPTAELKPDQKDTDNLPPYEVLDPILKAYIEDDKSYEEILDLGFDPYNVKRVITLVDRSEYKRRQSPPGIKITPRAFGRDRRFPITNKYRGCC